MVTHILDVHGDFACFSRPEMKVERWSYPCPTPSAARGIFDAVYCHPPEFRWQVTRVELLELPRYIALRRNEVKEVVNVAGAAKWLAGTDAPKPIVADQSKEYTGSDERGRTQRQTMALKSVRYRLHAHIDPWPGFKKRLKGFDEQFARRARHGQCFTQPYLGCREFVGYFRYVDDLVSEPPPVAFDQEIGLMLYDVFDLSRTSGPSDRPFITLFRAAIRGGMLCVPPFEDDRVLKPGPTGRRAG